MPIEIRELVIKATVNPSRGEGRSVMQQRTQPAAPSEEFVQEIVDKVIEVLERKQER
jgi:hypothetical protein